jgi:hypothetical protein
MAPCCSTSETAKSFSISVLSSAANPGAMVRRHALDGALPYGAVLLKLGALPWKLHGAERPRWKIPRRRGVGRRAI